MAKKSLGLSSAAMYTGGKTFLCGGLVMLVLMAAFLRATQSSGYIPVIGGLVQESVALLVEKQIEQNGGRVRIQDAVRLPDDEILLLFKTPPLYELPDREEVSCVFRSGKSSPIRGIDHDDGKAAIRCAMSSNRSRFVGLKTEEGGEVRVEPGTNLLDWSRLVFEAVNTREDVVVFAKGLSKRGYEPRLKDFKCVFGSSTKTEMTSAVQEVFRCAHPPSDRRELLVGSKVTIEVNGSVIPSVAIYGASMKHEVASRRKKHLLCSCTMVYNIAKFLNEWVIYHSKLGVEKFFLYDNNSDDNLKQLVSDLSSKYNVSRHFWPWIKSQEAGFSHCALRAQAECTWVAYTDVDEFIYPGAWLQEPRPLQSLVQGFSPHSGKVWWWKPLRSLWRKSQVGQIMIGCRVFGPSGLQKHPSSGVTQGYTCRVKKTQRHKSIVLLDALHSSLLNVVHHFNLRRGYISTSVPVSMGIIQHYKYQAWDEFKAKFKRRVSTYVTDWKTRKNLDSKDRTPGLGTKEIEPRNWKQRFCEVKDTIMQRYVAATFGIVDEKGTLKMPWEQKS